MIVERLFERKPSKFEIARVGRPLVVIAMEKVKEGNVQRRIDYQRVAIFVKDNRFIRLTDANVVRVGKEYVSSGDLSNGLILESFNTYRGQVTRPELTLGLPRSDDDKDFIHLRGAVSFAELGIMAAITEELKIAKKISIKEFDKALKIYNKMLRRRSGRKC